MSSLKYKEIVDALVVRLPFDIVDKIEDSDIKLIVARSFNRLADLYAELVLAEEAKDAERSEDIIKKSKLVMETLLDVISLEDFNKTSNSLNNLLSELSNVFIGAMSKAIELAAAKAADMVVEIIASKLRK